MALAHSFSRELSNMMTCAYYEEIVGFATALLVDDCMVKPLSTPSNLYVYKVITGGPTYRMTDRPSTEIPP